MPRLFKQIIIAAVFFLVIGSIVYFYLVKDSSEPLPSPEITAQPLKVVSQKLLKISDFDYDFLAEIKNPNTDFGATDAGYELRLFGQNNELIAEENGSMILLPGQTHYEIISPLRVDREIFNTEFKITDTLWERLKDFIPQNLFLVQNQEFESLPPAQGFLRFEATLFNNSNFDFDRTGVYIILFDENNNVLAVNKTDIRTFLAKTDRFFEVKWSKPFNGVVSRVYVGTYTDVYKNENFIKEHGTQEKFQKFY